MESRRDALQPRFRWGLYTIAVLAVVISFFPIIWLVFTSLKTSAGIYAWPPQYLPSPPTLQHYITILTNSPELLRYIFNSFVVGIGSTILVLAFGGLCAYAITRLKLRFAQAVLIGILAVSMFPPVSLLPAMFQLFRELGLLNTYLGLIIAHAGSFLPLAVWILSGFFASLPVEIEEAARLDGMGFLRIFVSIVVPLSKPGFIATGLIVFIFSWNEFPLSLVLMPANDMRTAPVGISLYPGEFAFPWETISTATVLAIIPILIITAIFQKQIVGGLTAGVGK